jgi:hypothetical protein
LPAVTPEISLSHRNGRWRAQGLGGALDLEHAELRALEALIEATLASRCEPCAVVRFDTESLPVWLRQYQTHYFNYTLRPRA